MVSILAMRCIWNTARELNVPNNAAIATSSTRAPATAKVEIVAKEESIAVELKVLDVEATVNAFRINLPHTTIKRKSLTRACAIMAFHLHRNVIKDLINSSILIILTISITISQTNVGDWLEARSFRVSIRETSFWRDASELKKIVLLSCRSEI